MSMLEQKIACLCSRKEKRQLARYLAKGADQACQRPEILSVREVEQGIDL